MEWFHNGKALTTGHRFRTVYDFGFAALDILSVYPEDSGEYTCRAVNKIGSDETVVHLSCNNSRQIVTEAQHEVGFDKLQYLEDKSKYQRSEMVEETCTQVSI